MSGAFDHDGRALKVATARLVKDAGGIEAAASLLGKGKSVVGRWVNVHDGEHFINLRDLRELEVHAPAPVVTAALSRLAGGVFVPLPHAPWGEDTLPMQVLTLAQELGDVSHKITDGLRDGALSPDEAQAALDELHQLDMASARLRLMLEALARPEASEPKLRGVG